jgi:rhodanese-related sulfurtransferase
MSKKVILSISVLLFSFTLLFAGGQAEQQEIENDYTDPAVLQRLMASDDQPYTLVDVRTPAEFASGHIPKAVNISVNSIGSTGVDAPKDSLVIVYCRSGNRSAVAASQLKELGYTSVVDFGGINRWPYDIE